MSAPTSSPNLIDYAVGLLHSEAETPRRQAGMDRLLRELAEHLVDPDDPASEFDLVTLAGLHDELLEENDATAARAALESNPRKLQQVIDLAAVMQAYREDVGTESSELPVFDDFVPAETAPVINLAERRSQRNWLLAAASLAAVVMLGLFLVVPRTGGLPGPLDARMVGLDSGRTLRSGDALRVGDTLAVAATVSDDTSWAVIGIAARSGGLPVRVWVAQTSTTGLESDHDADGRVTYGEQLTLPGGRRAYFVVASAEPMVDLPALAATWESGLRDDGRRADAFARDLQAIMDAEAGGRAWRVARAVRVDVIDDSF